MRPGHPADPGAWPLYGGDPGQGRSSPLDQIDRSNVADLELAWRRGVGTASTFETTPVVGGGGMVVTAPMERRIQSVLRLDPASGEVVWRRDLEIGEARIHPRAVNRGAALDLEGGRVHVGLVDAHQVALDFATGEILWKTSTGAGAAGYSHKQAPTLWEGRVYTGVSASPFGIRGWVGAFDGATGEELWRWHTIPSPDDGGWWGEWLETLPGTGISLHRDIERERAGRQRYADAWRRGGAAPWMTPTLDPERGLLFVGIGSPAPELNAWVRPGDNRWSNSVCALRMEDGVKAWCFQILPHDRWGLDTTSPPFLFEMERDGEAVPALGQFTKLGLFYAWHRETGELLTVSEPYVPHERFLQPPSREGTRMAPGIYGGTQWSPAAWSPQTGLAYAVNLHLPGTYVIRDDPTGRRAWAGAVGFDAGPRGERWGSVVALDPASGELVWEARTPRPMVGGVLVTAGGLVFAGRLDGRFGAWDAETGEELWSFATGAGCAAAPMTYELDGAQYLAVACGGHFLGDPSRPDEVIAFRLPRRGD